MRDKFSCQYCGSGNELTFDHLLPRSKGGKTNWDNVVTACSSCNVQKGGIKPKKIVFSGVGKTSKELRFAIEKKILLIEDLYELVGSGNMTAISVIKKISNRITNKFITPFQKKNLR